MGNVGIYKKGGASVSRFHKKDYDQWDEHSRSISREFFTQYGWTIVNNDGKGSVAFNPCDTDLRGKSPTGKTWFIECETKRSGFEPKYLVKGLHYTWRKISSIFGQKQRDPESTVFVTVNTAGTELILVSGMYLRMAYEIWPEYAGYNEIEGSSGFKLPEHGCYPLYKSTFRGKAPEHFVTINWDRCAHYVKQNGVWKRLRKSDGKYLPKK